MTLIFKLYDLLVAFVNYFVHVTYRFDLVPSAENPDIGQWVLYNYYSYPTEKGWAVLDALATITHNGLVFVAQLMTLLPAASGQNYPTEAIGTPIIP